MVLELHECATTLTAHCKALRSLGVESNAITIDCFVANGGALDGVRLILLVPAPLTARPSETLRRELPRLRGAAMLALLNPAQHAHHFEWIACGAQVVAPLPLSHCALRQQIGGLLALTPPTSLVPSSAGALSRIERRILELISSEPGRPFSRTAILEHIYDDHRVVCERTVDAHVKNLRRKLGTGPGRAAVRSVYGEGYAFEPA